MEVDDEESQSSEQGPTRKRNIDPHSDSDIDPKKYKYEGSSSDESSEDSSSLFSSETYSKKGLVQTLHGDVYQLKLLMLFLKRALDMKYEFNLGTEVEDAEKLDDVVLRIKKKNNAGKSVIRFLQAKHKQNEFKKISVSDLEQPYNSNESAFSLQQYFISTRSIDKNSKFDGHEKVFIIYTNIDFADLGSIVKETIQEPDDIIQGIRSGNPTNRYKLIVPKEHEVIKKLRETSDLHILANTLKQHIHEKKKLQLKLDIFRRYDVALCTKILNIEEKSKRVQKRFATFRPDFLSGNNLDAEVQNFRIILQSDEGSNFWNKLSQERLDISEKFGKDTAPVNGNASKTTDLPKDQIEDEDIDIFFKRLVFAVNQPNELELGDMITKEMGESSQFNLLNANLVSDSFQRQLLDWFKEKRPETGQEGVWLNAKSGQEFLNSIEKQITSLVSIGINVAYPEELARYKVAYDENTIFQELRDFLRSNNKKILSITAQDETLLSAINVNCGLEKLKKESEFTKYKSKDSYIFIRLTTLLGEKIQKYVMDAFESKENYNVLIIDCASLNFAPEHVQLYLQLYMKISSIILQNINKKVIFITKNNNMFVNFFTKDLKLDIIDESNFNHLSKKSKENILGGKQVTFHGHKTYLKKFIGESDANNIIDAEVLLKLLRGEEIIINHAVNDLGDVSDYYINRRFRPIVLSKKNLQRYLEKSSTHSDFFVVCGVDSGLTHSNVFTCNDSLLAESKFIELCKQNEKSNIHWLKNDSINITWNRSYGSISNIIKCKKSEEFHSITKNLSLIHETDLVNKKGLPSIIIISDTAGMGKSTVLTHLSMEKSLNNVWLTRINFNDHTAIFAKILENFNYENTDKNSNEAFDLLFKELLTLGVQSNLDKKMFNNVFLKNRKLVFIFDGFDEICPDYKDIVIDLLQRLKQWNLERIYVTTRPNVKKDLEQALESFSYVLEPFSKQEQIDFLIKFWTKRLDLYNADQKCKMKLNTYATSVIEHVSKSLNDVERKFIGIPLQTMMIAEVFQKNLIGKAFTWQNCQEFLESEVTKPILPNNFGFLDLYENFVRRKFEDFYLISKKKRHFTIVGEKEVANSQFELFKKKCIQLSLQSLFSKDKLENLLTLEQMQDLKNLIEDFKDNKHNEGIINQFADDKPQFVHRTFAEYFVSFFIAEKLVTSPKDTLKFMESIILNMSPIFMSSLVHLLDCKHDNIANALEAPLLYYIFKQNYSNIMKSLLELDLKQWPKKLDTFGKSFLHYAVDNGNTHGVENLLHLANDIPEKNILRHGTLKNSEYKHSNLVKFINLEDNSNNTALFYALSKDNYEIGFMLLLKGACIDSIAKDLTNKLVNEMLHLQDNTNGIFNYGILGVYADQNNKFRPIQEKILLKAPFVFNELGEKDQSRILSYFFVHGRVKVINVLLETIDDIEKRKEILNYADNGSTPLDRVNTSSYLSDDDRLEITKYLLEHGFALNDQNVYQILQVAARNGSIKTFKYFISHDKNGNYNEYLNEACRCNQLSIVKYLLENHATQFNVDGNTVLHSACHNKANIKTIRYLVENNYNINARNLIGETPLYIAIQARNSLNTIKYLIENGSVDSEDLFGNTPLSNAITSNQDTIITYLLENNAQLSERAPQLLKDKVEYYKNRKVYDLDLINAIGYPRLHTAILEGDFEWAQFLLRHGANVNKLDEEGGTALHWACAVKHETVGQHEFVELLLQFGIMIDVKNQNDKKPIDLVTETDSKIYWLLNLIDDVLNSTNLMTILCEKQLLERVSGEIDYARWGPYGGGFPDEFDCNNPFLLILHARNSKGKTLVHLAAGEENGYETLSIILKYDQIYAKRNPELSKFKDYHPLSIDLTDSEGNTPLHIAAQNGHIDVVLLLLKRGAIFNNRNHQQETPEMLALKNDHLEVAERLELIKRMFAAIEQNNISEFITLVEKSRDGNFVKVKNESGETLLHIAALLSQVVAAQLLLDKGANVDSTDLRRNTPLHSAAESNEIEIVKLLLRYGAIYNAQNFYEQIPLDKAGQNQGLHNIFKEIDTLFKDIQREASEFVIKKIQTMREITNMDIKSIINIRDEQSNTLLHYAAELCEYDLVKFLLENGAYYNVQNNYDWFPINLTKDDNILTSLNTIEKMFENLCDIDGEKKVDEKVITNVRDNTGKELIHYAVKECSLVKVKFLVENGTYVNLTDFDYTFSDEEFNQVKIDIFKYLIDNGNVNTINYKGETPLLIAVNSNSPLQIIEHLVLRGSDVNCKDFYGNTSLSRAEEKCRYDIIEYLTKEEKFTADEDKSDVMEMQE